MDCAVRVRLSHMILGTTTGFKTLLLILAYNNLLPTMMKQIRTSQENHPIKMSIKIRIGTDNHVCN